MKNNALGLLLLFVCVSSQLVAQTPPVVTLSANTFYRGDAAGSYTVTCPAGTSAGVSALTKIADVPLLNPASTQYGIGVTFPWPPASSPTPILTGTLPQSFTQTAMGGNVVYGAGVLSGYAYCYSPGAGGLVTSTQTAFTITLNGSTREEAPLVQARLTYALKANSLKLPQLGTTEQNSLPPQQAGNLLYNANQQKMAVHTGTDWKYLSTTTETQVGIGGPVQPSAVLSLSATDKGFLIPRLTTAQKNAIASPAEGLMVYDSDLKQFSYCVPSGSGFAWISFGNPATIPNSWSASGNDISNTNAGNVNIGGGTLTGKLSVTDSRTTTFGSSSALWVNTQAGNGQGLYVQSSGRGITAESATGEGLLGSSSAANTPGVKGVTNNIAGIGGYFSGTYLGGYALLTGFGNVGINTAAPKSKLDVNGSFSAPIRTVTASTTLTDDDYTVIADMQTDQNRVILVTLPDPTTCKGRIYTVKANNMLDTKGPLLSPGSKDESSDRPFLYNPPQNTNSGYVGIRLPNGDIVVSLFKQADTRTTSNIVVAEYARSFVTYQSTGAGWKMIQDNLNYYQKL
jgi:hypothetical protein